MASIELGPGYWLAWSGDMAAAFWTVLVLAILATSIPVAVAIARLASRCLGKQARRSVAIMLGAVQGGGT